VDALDDLDLAVETLLADEPAAGGQLELRVGVTKGRYQVCLAGLRSPSTREALSCGGAEWEETDGLLDLRRILASLVDAFSLEEQPGDTFAVCLEKRIP
jgi:hypothetical protein